MIITHYKLIDTRARWFGIDLFDAISIIALFAILSMFTEKLFFNITICAVGYLSLRIWKSNKPEGWFLDWLRYHFRSPYYTATRSKHGSRKS